MAFERFIYIIGILVISFNPIVHGSVEAVSVDTGIGTIIGSKATVKVNNIDYTLKTFLGIPYARPPIGDLRFQRPEPMPGFDTPFEAVNFGKACLQPDQPGMPVYNQSEDCLYLNVYVPEQTPDMESGHAVMVFIHGGGLTTGAGETYPGEELCSFGNVIVVTINYRLGVFGFMNSGDGAVPGNFALYDQHLAFKWVNANIGAFGGDKNRVTIFGQSAGATAVVIQGLYPSNKDFIHRVISQSSVTTIDFLLHFNPKENCLTIAKELGCDGTSINDAISCMRTINADTFMNTLNEMFKDPEKALATLFLPAVDGEIIQTPSNTISSLSKIEELEEVNFFRSLDFMSGFTNLDGGVFLTMLNQIEDLETFTITREEFITNYVPTALAMAMGPVPDGIKSLVVAAYTNWTDPNLPENNRDQYVRLLGDIFYTAGNEEMSRLHSNVSEVTQDTFAFLLSAKPSNHILQTPTWFKGANHGDDLSLVFLFSEKMIDALVLEREIKQIADWEYTLAYQTATYWTNFAKTGNPNEPVEVPALWPRYESVNQQYVILDRDMSDKSIRNHLYAKEAHLWLEVIPEVTKAINGAHEHDCSSPFVKPRDGSCSADGKCDGD